MFCGLKVMSLKFLCTSTVPDFVIPQKNASSDVETYTGHHFSLHKLFKMKAVF